MQPRATPCKHHPRRRVRRATIRVRRTNRRTTASRIIVAELARPAIGIRRAVVRGAAIIGGVAETHARVVGRGVAVAVGGTAAFADATGVGGVAGRGPGGLLVWCTIQ